ncbi:MAG: hypothetical protein N2C13_02040, partial [Chloroflexota bacterium]
KDALLSRNLPSIRHITLGFKTREYPILSSLVLQIELRTGITTSKSYPESKRAGSINLAHQRYAS